MSKRKAIIHSAVLAVALISPMSAMAWVASEFTQIMNNIQLLMVAADSAKSAKAEISALAVQKQQHAIDIANNIKFGAMPTNASHNAKSEADLLAYAKVLTNLYGSLDEQKKMMEARMSEARLSGLTWDKYAATVQADAQNQNKRAINRMQYEASVLDQVKNDYDAARSFEPMIETAAGAQQSLQVLNKQMNRLVLQNAKLTETIVATMQEQSRAQADAAVTKERTTSELTRMSKQQQAIRDRQEAAAKALLNK